MSFRPVKFFTGFLLALFLVGVTVGPFVPTAFAEVPEEMPGGGAGGGLPVMIGGDLTKVAGNAYKNVLTEIVRTLTTALFNAAQTFLGQLAYDAANYIAAGGKGQAAQFYKKGFGDYLENVSKDAAGEFIGSMNDLQIGGTKLFDSLGFDLCRPKDPRKLLNIQLSLGNFFPGLEGKAGSGVSLNGKFSRPKPKCNYQEVMDNYDKLYETMSNSEVLDNVGYGLNSNTSEVGVAAGIGNLFTIKIAKEVEDKKKEREEGKGFKAVTGLISGNVRTPSDVVREKTSADVVQKPNQDQTATTGVLLGNAFKTGPIALVKYTASIFLNTLASKFLKRIFDEGLDAFDWGDTIPKRTQAGPDSVVTAGATDARKANIDLKTPQLQRSGEYDVLPELVLCPPEGSSPRGLFNCTVDQELISAIQSQDENGGITIAKALDRDLLHKKWHLIPDDTNFVKDNQDANCYLKNYCAVNLRKLRLNRILPVGFEFAANSAENKRLCAGSSNRCVTLETVVANFSNCNEEDDAWDPQHPWCHLIDPNWIITSPPQQCELMGYGDDLLSDQLDQRKQDCRDIQTCLSRNNKGECVGGYGYCVAERTVYRFTAEECPVEMASCRNFANRAGDEVSYLRNTIDYGACTTDNVGCLWYATERTSSGSAWDAGVATGARMYFDKTLAACDKGSEGCTKLLQIQSGVSALNMLANPSFESVTGSPALLTAWLPYRALAPSVGGAVDGVSVAEISDVGTAYHQAVALVPERTYTLSIYAKANKGQAKLSAKILQYKDAALAEPALAPGEVYASDGCVKNPDSIEIASNTALTWQRYVCTFIANVSARAADIRFGVSDLPDGTVVWYDAVQLEEGEYQTDFVEGLNASLTAVHLKVAPDELICTGKKPPELCDNFARSCRQMDAGCQGYTDLAGGSEIPAIISANDLCPSTCVGYAEYRKNPSSFDLIHDVTDPDFDDASDSGVSYFIPTTASLCKQSEVGCEEFTNVSDVGGEQTAAFRSLRLCEKPDANSQTYFTWEGSDTTGYQLHTWSLKKGGQRVGDAASGGPEVIKLRDLDGRFKDPSTCNDASWRSGADEDCRQFYDAEGTVFYRYYSQTILSIEACVPYRLDRTNFEDCEKTGGTFNGATGECVYQVYAPESMQCPAAAAGCRAYAGVASGNTAPVLKETFQDGKGAFTFGEKSSESLLVGSNSLRIQATNEHPTLDTSVAIKTEPGALYQVSFWTKGVGISTNEVKGKATLTVKAGSSLAGAVTMTADWQRFLIGPFSGATKEKSTIVSWNLASESGVFYIDEVVVTRIQDMVYARRDTWNTPDICDRSAGPDGVPQPQAMLGCRTYKDRNNQTVNLRQFTRLCRADAISCQGFVDTRNATNRDAKHISADTFVRQDEPFLPEFGAAEITRPAARYRYLINEPKVRCQPEQASCRAFGKPLFTPDRQALQSPTADHPNQKPFETVYFKDDILKYGDALCRPSEIFCEEFNGPNGTKEYFRDPQNHTCEYRTDIKVAGGGVPGVPPGIYSGWFQKGLDIPCYPNYLESGRLFNITRNGDTTDQQTNKYAGWVGECEQQYGECTELRDTNDHSDPAHPSGKSYYMINNEELDKKSCTTVDVANGCVLFRNMSDASRKYSTAATYAAYRKNLFKAVTPVSCELKQNDPICGKIQENDANMIVKVSMDRDCAEWLGCKTAETVLDPATHKYRDLCTSLALCDKSNGSGNDVFCAHYVDRSSAGTLFSRGAYFDLNRYVNRPIGLGAKDYSSYAVPDTFSVADMATVRAAKDGLGETLKNSKMNLALDYRLAATAPIRVYKNLDAQANGAIESSDHAVVVTDPSLTKNNTLLLCQHRQTGIIGYYLDQDLKSARAVVHKNPNQKIFINCYLPLHATTDAYSFQKVSERFAEDDPAADPVLQAAYPSPECKAQPEADAPFPASFVTAWDDAKTPPRALEKIIGYKGATTCEKDEDCVCAYKRLDYASGFKKKFVGIYSSNVAPGICAGGPRDGQSCLPASVYKAPVAENKTDGIKATEGSHENEVCGPPEGGGQCQELSSSQIVRGIFGGCLERDASRIIGADQGAYPCLTWNPTPITAGSKDPIHFVQTAGYFPPENSGQYYCMTPKGEVSMITLLNTDFPLATAPQANPAQQNVYGVVSQCGSPGGCNAGNETFIHYTQDKVSYGFYDAFRDDNYIYGGDPGAGLAGAAPTDAHGDRCEDADDEQHPDEMIKGIRLVDSGPGGGRSYTETFYRLADKLTDFGETVDNKKMTFIKIDPVLGDDSNIICAYNEAWVDGLDAIDADDGDLLKAQDKKWREKLAADYNNILTRGSEELLTESNNSSKARLVECPSRSLVDPGTPNLCYVKYWQTGYRDKGQVEFQGMDPALVAGKENWLFHQLNWAPRAEKCTSDKPYFAIRAVFERKVAAENPPIAPEKKAEILGKEDWVLVGFWVTTCGGSSERMYIYMQIDINRGELCGQLAEVRSKDSAQDAAFTDRVWRQSGYAVPLLGIQYNTRFSPFSSALNVGPAGKDPLFQTGGSMGGFSPFVKTVFKEAGAETYFGFDSGKAGDPMGSVPADRWSLLTNIFARVYRIYNWIPEEGEYVPGGSKCKDQRSKGVDDEFCGLWTEDIRDARSVTLSHYESQPSAPTDVTLGLYTPLYLGIGDNHMGYPWMSYYTPRPPRIAGPSISDCSAAGRCKIQKMDGMTFDTLSEGVIDVPGGEHRADLRFYAWAAHDQMPIRSMNIDWGDGSTLELPDARLKNHKPICGTIKECDDPMRGSGITCETDADCPAGAGTCKDVGTCQHAQNIVCRSNGECPAIKPLTVEQRKAYTDCLRDPKGRDCETYNTAEPDTCIYRQFFGNSSGACESNYFEFQHLYVCPRDAEKVLPSCEWYSDQELRCSRDPGRGCYNDLGCAAGDKCMPGLAPAGGCWDKKNITCRFTPRVLVEDNWGWCTGECRQQYTGVGYNDAVSSRVLHKYGGCYARAVRGETDATKIYFNAGNAPAQKNECDGSLFPSESPSLRPWIVYPGSLQLRW